MTDDELNEIEAQYNACQFPSDIGGMGGAIEALIAEVRALRALVDAATSIHHDIGAGDVWMFARDEGVWDVGVDGNVHASDLSMTEASALFRELAAKAGGT